MSELSGPISRINDALKIDRRSYLRIPVRLPGLVASVASRRFASNCTVVNISRGGALVALAKCCALTNPKPGQRAQLQIALAVASGYAARILSCEGRVIRVSASVAEPVEVALRFSRMEFRDAGGAFGESASTRRLMTTLKVVR